MYYRLLPFDDRNIREFLEKWFDHDTVLQQNIFERISANSNLKQFCRTPLILTLYSILSSTAESFEQLPVRRTTIYEQIIQMLLGKWDRLRNVKNQYDAELKQYLLEVIAYEAHYHRSRTFSMYQFSKLADEIMQSSGFAGDSEELINEIVFRSSLIRRTSTYGDYEFVHLSFQEYLAARRLSRNVESRSIIDDLEDEWWKGCLIFYFGISRTLDGLVIPRKIKKHRGIGLRFIEFLAEADFTSASRRSEVLSLLGNDLLGSVKLSNSDLQICSRLGNNLVQILKELVEREGFSGNFSNYFAIMRSIGTKRAIDAIWEQKNHLINLPVLSLAEELAKNIGSVNDEIGVKFIVDGMLALTSNLGSRRLDNPAEVVPLCSYISETATFLSIWISKSPIEQKFIAKIMQNWEMVCEKFTVCLCNTDTLKKLSRRECKEVLATILLTWNGINSILASLVCVQTIPAPSESWWRQFSRFRISSFIKQIWFENASDTGRYGSINAVRLDAAREKLKKRFWYTDEIEQCRNIFEQTLQIEKIWT